QLIPIGPLGEVEGRDRSEQLRLRLGELDRLGAQPLLQEPLAPPQPLVHLGARLGIRRRQALQPLVPRLVARLDEPADLIDELVVVGHGWSTFPLRLSESVPKAPEGRPDVARGVSPWTTATSLRPHSGAQIALEEQTLKGRSIPAESCRLQ